MSKYCEQCGTKLEDGASFCSACGAKCREYDLKMPKKNKRGKQKKLGKKRMIVGMIIVVIIFVAIAGGGVQQFFKDMAKGYNEAVSMEQEDVTEQGQDGLAEDGTAYQMTVEEYCEKFNEIATQPWCSGDINVTRAVVERERRKALEDAARTDPDIEEQLIQTMTPEMIPGVTLMKDDAPLGLPNSEDYVTYVYVNQYSFIPGNISISLLAKKDTDQIMGISAMFSADYKIVGDRLGELICDSFGEDTPAGGFQDLYNKMKEAGGYGHSYKDGTVFELLYQDESDNILLFKMSACTEEHYEEEWVNDPDVPSKENPIKNTEENTEQNTDSDAEYNADQNVETQQSEILEMFDNLIFYEGTWGEFGAHVNEYQGMVETAIKSSISLEDYFGDANGTYMLLEKQVMNDDVLENGKTATNQLYMITFQGPSVTGTGGERTLECTVSSPDGVRLVYNEGIYY